MKYFIVFLIMLSFLQLKAMDQTDIPCSAIEKDFLEHVLGLPRQDEYRSYDETLIQYKKSKNQIIKTLKELSDEDTILLLQNLFLKMKEEQKKEIAETYEQFIRWRTQRNQSTKLRDLKFLFAKMARENNFKGLQAIEWLAVEWKLTTTSAEKVEKLGYLDALEDAIKSGSSIVYFCNKKEKSEDISRKIENYYEHRLYNIQYETKQVNKPIKEKGESYKQFIKRWNQSPESKEQRGLIFAKITCKYHIQGIKTIAEPALTSDLTANPTELHYRNELKKAVMHGDANKTESLLNKNNISLNNNVNFVAQVCWGIWGYNETQQLRVVRAMIRKGAPSRLNDVRMYLLIAQESDAPERLIKYLKELEISRSNRH